MEVKFVRLLTAIFIMIINIPAQAHEFWMVAHDANTQVNEKVLFELRIGSGWPGEKSIRIPHLVRDFNAWDNHGKYSVSGHDGSLVLGHITPKNKGATVVGLTTNAAQLELSAEDFNAYLKEEGLNRILTLRKNTGQLNAPDLESFSRSAKSIIIVDNDSQGFDRIIELPLELIPLTDPLSYQLNSSFKVQLLRDGHPLSDTQVKAQVNSSSTLKLLARTDKNGYVTFQLPKHGYWIFSAVDMQISNSLEADWESLWGSLSIKI